MKTQVQKWGNSLGVRIPKEIAKQCNIGPGSHIEISIDESNNIVMSFEYSKLDQLLDRISSDNLHNEEFNEDEFLGKEIW